jgi:hypothetical protein
MWLRTRVAAVAAAGCCVAGMMVAGLAPAAAASAGGSVFVPLGPVRVMDTRNGTGVAKAPVGPGKSVSLKVTGVDGVPASGVTAVVLNVTAVSPTASTNITVYPDGPARPGTSNLNVTRGEVIANLVTVPVSTDGKVDFFNDAGSVNLVADLSGYDTDSGNGSLLGSIGPVRVMDTRNGTGVAKAPVGPGKSVSLQVDGVDGVPAAGVTAVVLNVTATGPTASTDITVYPDGPARPGTSNLNVTAGETLANLVVVPVSNAGKVDFFNDAGSVNLIADLSGYYTAAGAGFTGLGPVRVMDTRNGTGVAKAPVGPGKSVSLQIAGADGVPAAGVTAVVLNVTATGPTASTDITVYADGPARPATSNLNVTAGETLPNLVVAPVGTDGKVDFFNDAGTVNLVVDLSGYYTAGGAPWGNATQIPGLAAINTGANSGIYSVSCPSSGNCTVGGYYVDNSGNQQAFVADEVNGTWHDATELVGTGGFNTGNGAFVESVSCASAGNCAAGGYYEDNSNNVQAFVADEVNGTWDDATEVPGTGALNTRGYALITSVSCASAGICAAGGYYTDSSGIQAFVADEANGTWGDATEVPGSGALNNGIAEVDSVSCASAGNCTAGGYYTDSSGYEQAFVADEANGSWGDATEVSGTASLGRGTITPGFSVSCASAGNCTAGGSDTDSSGNQQVFVGSEVSGAWGNAVQVPDSAALNTAGSAMIESVSCPSAGNCSAGGLVDVGTPDSGSPQPFVVSEMNGTWGNAVQVPGIPSFDNGVGTVSSVSCASAGNCVAGGSYGEALGPDNVKAFVVSEVNGTWGEAVQVADVAPFAQVLSVSCPPTGGCTAGGVYPSSGAFVISQN